MTWSLPVRVLFSFFFQAEDGIRDHCVTGVQTCALPISRLTHFASVSGFAEGEVSKPSDKYVGGKNTQGATYYLGPCTPANQMAHHYAFVQIGRASCRERV